MSQRPKSIFKIKEFFGEMLKKSYKSSCSALDSLFATSSLSLSLSFSASVGAGGGNYSTVDPQIFNKKKNNNNNISTHAQEFHSNGVRCSLRRRLNICCCKRQAPQRCRH
jgi:hypothetical protein